MRIDTLALHQTSGWPELGTDALAPGLNVFHGSSACGKTTIADLLTHTIYGRRLAQVDDVQASGAPDGEVIIEHRDRRYRLRRSYDATAGERLTVAALDQSPVDQDTVHQLVACLSPSLLRPLFAVGFRTPPRLDWLLSAEFSHEFRSALWRLKWAPPTVNAELRPIYARLRALETEVTTLVRGLQSETASVKAARKTKKKTRVRRASYFLAQLTDGELLRLCLGPKAGKAHVVTRSGDLVGVDSLWSTQRDQVYLSLCFALAAALSRQGVKLPLVLDEPFTRFDARASAALVDTLDDFAHRGHQVVVFTGQQEAAERFASLGARMHDVPSLRGKEIVATVATPTVSTETTRIRRRVKTTRMKHREAG